MSSENYFTPPESVPASYDTAERSVTALSYEFEDRFTQYDYGPAGAHLWSEVRFVPFCTLLTASEGHSVAEAERLDAGNCVGLSSALRPRQVRLSPRSCATERLGPTRATARSSYIRAQIFFNCPRTCTQHARRFLCRIDTATRKLCSSSTGYKEKTGARCLPPIL